MEVEQEIALKERELSGLDMNIQHGNMKLLQ
jgi:hypothetical protein